MRVISHRGNVFGPGSQCERKNIERAYELGYDVELDVWIVNEQFYVGHDEPLYELPLEWIDSAMADRTWFHAKNIFAYNALKGLGVRTFMHADESWAPIGALQWHHPRLNDSITFKENDVVLDVNGHARIDIERVRKTPPYAICTDWADDWKAFL